MSGIDRLVLYTGTRFVLNFQLQGTIAFIAVSVYDVLHKLLAHEFGQDML